MRYGFGIDIRSSIINIGYFDETGKMLFKWSIPTPLQYGSSEVLPAIADQIEDYMHRNGILEDEIIGIGVGIPGPVNRTGTVNKCVNLGWGVFNIDRTLSGLTGLNVTSGNTATLAAFGEAWKGCARGCEDMIYMAMNTGLGGAVIANGRLVRGAHGGGGEFGHMAVNRDETETCTCGNKGCLEQYFSPFGITRIARRKLAAGLTPSSLRLKRHLSHDLVIQAAMDGDKIAVEVMDKVFQYAGEMLADISCVTNPDTVVLGGELCKYPSLFRDNLSRYFHKYAFHANREVRFLMATLGEDAPLFGAFRLVLDTFNT